MAQDFKGVQKTSINDLINMLNAFSGGQKETESQVVKDAIATHSIGIFNSFDNESFTANVAGLDNWYAQNSDDLTEDEISRYELIKRRSVAHQKKFNTFDAYYKMMHDSAEEMKVLISGGVDAEGNPVQGFNDLDDEGKALVAGIIKEKEISYISNKEMMQKKFGDLLQHPSGKFMTEAIALDSWDNYYQYGLVSIKDQLVDKNELYTLSEGLKHGNLEEWNNYKQTEEAHRQQAQTFHRETSIPLIEEVNYKGELLDNYEYIEALAEAAAAGVEGAESTLNTLKDGLVHTTVDPRNPYAFRLPSNIGPVDYTWQQLLDGEANALMDIYRQDLISLNKKLYTADQGYQNVTKGMSLTNVAPIRYKPWGNKISDPYQRIEFEKPEDKDRTSKLSIDEQNLVQDYRTDLARKKALDEWFEDYPYAGSSPEEKKEMANKTLGGQIVYRSNLKKELKVLKTKWFKKQTHKYDGITYEQTPQNTIFEIAKRGNLKDIDRMFE